MYSVGIVYVTTNIF